MDRVPEHQKIDDYYTRQERKHCREWMESIKVFAWLTALLLIGMLLFGCAVAKVPPATSSTGTVIDVSGEVVWVLFDVVNRKPGDKATNWFHIPGHRYHEGDLYPDPYKDPELEKLLLSPHAAPR